jgi:hypothetical protein
MKRFVFIMLAMALAGCGSSGTDVQPNTPPEITFSFPKLAVPKGIDVDLFVTVSDEDKDPLTVQWEATAGTLDPADQGKTIMTWTPPTTIGTYTITATASDGKDSKSASLSLKTGTRWSTNIIGNTSWSNALSPYILAPDAGVANFRISGGKLSIGPGVTVYVDTEALEFNVVGTLEILGTESQPVIITPNDRSPAVGYWKGILADIEGAQVGHVNLSYARISYAQYDIRADEYTNVNIAHCKLSNAEDAGVYFRSEGMLTIESCDISQNKGDGIYIEKLSDTPYTLTVAVTNSTIQSNGGSGVEINLDPFVGKNAIINFTDDVIIYNGYHGINLLDGAFPHIERCAIYLNDIYREHNGFNVRIDPSFVGAYDSVDARGNFWGAPYALPKDSTEIQKLIYDKMDNAALPKVLIVPWCPDYPCL